LALNAGNQFLGAWLMRDQQKVLNLLLWS
jgi:hypothetical protein